MRSTVRSLCLSAAFAMPLLLVSATPGVAADANAFVMQGSGTFSPGLGALVETQAMSLTGTATTIGTSGVLAAYGCNFTGSFTGNLAGGVGNFSGDCGPMPLACVYVMVLGHWVGTCVGSVTAAIDCTITYDNTLPTTSYEAVCLGQSVKVP